MKYLKNFTMHLRNCNNPCNSGTDNNPKDKAQEYLAVGLKIPVQQGNVWVNCLSFDEHIPAMSQHEAVRFGAAIGTTLVAPHTVNLISDAHQRALRRKHVARRSGKIFLSFVFGVAVGVAIARLIAIPEVHSKIVEVLHKIPTRW